MAEWFLCELLLGKRMRISKRTSMDENEKTLSAQTPRRPLAASQVALFGGLAALLLLALLCMAAVAGAGGALWLRNARLAASTETLSPPVEPTVAPAAQPAAVINRIAFIDPDGRLGTVAPDGDELRMLSAAGASYQFPAWSPDGAHIAAVGVEGNEGGVFVWRDEVNARRVSLYTSNNRAPIYLYWSPDGRQISFLANAPSGLGLWLATADGATAARQIASGQPFYWDWSRNSDQLFIHSGGSGAGARLAFLDPVGDLADDSLASPGLFQAPGISADGRYVAYAEAEGGQFQVVVVARDGSGRFAAPHLGLAALGWSPVRNQLAWTSPRRESLTSFGPLSLLNAKTGDVVTLVRDTVIGFFWSPDGRRIAYLTLAGRPTNPGAGGPTKLAAISPAPLAQHEELRLTLAVVDVASGQQRVLTTFRPTPIFVTQFLPFFDQYALSHRLWSPTGDAIVLPMVDDDGTSGIYVVSVENGETTRVADGTMAFWSWR